MKKPESILFLCAHNDDQIVGAGGTGTLTYVLNEDLTNTTGNLSGVYRNLLAQAWTVTVTDMNGCNVTTAGITLTDPPVVTSVAVKQSPYNGVYRIQRKQVFLMAVYGPARA